MIGDIGHALELITSGKVVDVKNAAAGAKDLT
jgi:hypothetical protein